MRSLRFVQLSLYSALATGMFFAAPAPGDGAPETEAPVIGIGRKYSVPSSVLGEKVDLVVHLPGDYASGEKRYPVLIFLGSDYRAKYALAAATLDYMCAQGQIPGVILVGVDLPHGNFVQVPQEDAGGTTSADRHVAVLAGEIIPFVDRAFRTNGYSILYGGSNSGVFAVHAWFTVVAGRLRESVPSVRGRTSRFAAHHSRDVRGLPGGRRARGVRQHDACPTAELAAPTGWPSYYFLLLDRRDLRESGYQSSFLLVERESDNHRPITLRIEFLAAAAVSSDEPDSAFLGESYPVDVPIARS